MSTNDYGFVTKTAAKRALRRYDELNQEELKSGFRSIKNEVVQFVK